jgi:hypothetical protein
MLVCVILKYSGVVVEKVVNLINFGSELKPDVISCIEADHSISIDQIMIRASLNLKKHSSYIQVHDIIKENMDKFNGDFFIINLPGLPIYAAFVVTEIHALTGKFPIIVECCKNFASEGMFTEFKYKRLYDCDRERTQSREDFRCGGCK